MMQILTWKFDMHHFENSLNDREAEMPRYDSELDAPFSSEVKVGTLYAGTRGDIYIYISI